MKSALKKDTVREIRHSLGRFLSPYAVLDAVCHNGQRIQQAWEDDEEG